MPQSLPLTAKVSKVPSDQATQNFVSIVSVFSYECGFVYQMQAMENHNQSEQSVVQQLLARLKLDAVVVMLDALHTQKKPERKLLRGDNYLVCAKANQPHRYQAIEGDAWSCYDYTQCGHGRSVHRRVQVFQPSSSLKAQWHGLASLIVVERSGTRQNQPFTKRQYYISSLLACAQDFARLVQGDWRIENRLHWVKHVSLHEDQAPDSNKRAAANVNRSHVFHYAGKTLGL